MLRRKHFRTIYPGHWGSNTDGLDINEKMYRRQRGTELLSVRGHSTAVTILAYLLHFPPGRREEKAQSRRVHPPCLSFGSHSASQTLISKCGPRTSTSVSWELARDAQPGPTEAGSASPGDAHARSSCGLPTLGPTSGEPREVSLFFVSSFTESPKCKHPLSAGTIPGRH